jgi:hypothetical protein
MPNDTVVQYILNVDSKTAEKGLDRTAKEAGETVQSFDRLSKASTRTTAGLKATGIQATATTGKVRALRRAGRDLDGALMDLGQGLSLINPAMGNLIMNLSDAASIAEGFGRIGTLLLNPAFLTMAGIVATLGVAFVAFNAEQEKAKAEAEAFSKQLAETNKQLEEQEKKINAVNQAIGGYVTNINNAALDLAVLQGVVTEFEAAQDRATMQVEQFRQAQQQKISGGIEEALKTQEALNAVIEKSKSIIEEETRIIAGIKVVETDRGKEAQKILATKQLELDEINKTIQALKIEEGLIASRSEQLEKTLQKTVKIREEKKQEAKQDKEDQTAEKDRQKEINAVNAELAKIQAAKNQLLLIGKKTTEATLTEEEKIKNAFDDQIALVNSLAIKSEDLALGNEIALALENEKIRLLGLVNDKEEERVDIIKDQAQEAQKLFNVVNATISALQSPEALVGGLGGILGGVADIGGFAGLGAAAPAVSAAGSALTGIAGLGSAVEQEIQRAAAQEVPVVLDEKQARKVVLGNMEEAFEGFTRDLERGLELLPRILIHVLPEFTASLIKVIQVDLARVLILELPVAIAAGIIMAIPAMINEIGFLFADVVNSLSFLFDQLKAFLSGDRERRTQEERKAGRKEFRQQAFPGIQAAIESVQNFAGGGSFIPHAAGGMRFTGSSRQGLAMLHQNEFVVPASGQRPQSVDRQMSAMSGGVNITVNGTIVEQNAIDALVRKIEERFNSNYGLASSNLFGGR